MFLLRVQIQVFHHLAGFWAPHEPLASADRAPNTRERERLHGPLLADQDKETMIGVELGYVDAAAFASSEGPISSEREMQADHLGMSF
jgi:hypothetical protein